MSGHWDIFDLESSRLLKAINGVDSESSATAVRTWPYRYSWHSPTVWRWEYSFLRLPARYRAPACDSTLLSCLGRCDDINIVIRIIRMAGLKKLDFSKNRCKHISPFIGLMKDLTDLNLRGNRLKDVPNELGAIGNMKLVDLGENRWPTRMYRMNFVCTEWILYVQKESIWKDRTQPSQRAQWFVISVCCDRLKEVPECLATLHNMSMLWLDHNEIKQIPVRQNDTMRSNTHAA